MTERALEIYQDEISKRNLSVRARELVASTKALQEKMDSLRENIVSLLVLLAA